MKKQAMLILTGLVLLFSMTGCDDFSLLELFSKQLNLVMENNFLKPGEESRLYPAGGMAPYSFAVLVDDLYDDGHASDPGTIANLTYTAGASIGTVKIRLTDNAGDSAEVMVTILPWKPQNFSADGAAGGPTDIDLTWTYDTPGYIGGFRILRSANGGEFVEIASPGSTSRNYTDSEASPQVNIYRLYAVAGEYLSVFAETSAQGGA